MTKTIKNIISGSSTVLNIAPGRSSRFRHNGGSDTALRDMNHIGQDWERVGSIIRGSMDKSKSSLEGSFSDHGNKKR